MTYSSHHLIRLVIAIGFSIYGFYLRFQAYAQRDLWVDELYQLHNTVGPFKPFWQRIDLGELTAFNGDYLLNWPFVQIFNSAKWGIAIPHIISTLIGFYLFYLICNKHLRSNFTFALAFAYLCFHQHLIFHAFEFRPYAVLPTLALACFYFSENLTEQFTQCTRKKKFWIGFLFVFTIFYHAYGILIVGCCLLYAMLKQTSAGVSLIQVAKRMQHFLFGLAATALPVFLWFATGDLGFNYQHTRDRNINTFDYIVNPLNNFDKFYRTILNNLLGFKKLKFFMNIIYPALILPHRYHLTLLGFFCLLIVLPLEATLLADLDKGYWFVERQYIWVMPLFIFFVAWCWDLFIFEVKQFVHRKFKK